jgi:uncharacterized Zn finger protein (UPF0148 family)
MSARKRSALIAALAVALSAGISDRAIARPGGGNTFSAPSRPSTPARSFSPSTPSRPSTPSWPSTPSTPSRPSSPSWPSSPSGDSPSYPSGDTPSYGGGGYEPVDHSSLAGLLFESPLGILVLAGLVFAFGYAIYKNQERERAAAWGAIGRAESITFAGPPKPLARPERAVPMRTYLEGLRTFDPEFSIVLFEDFLHALYAKVHEARGRGALAELSPYVAPAARKGLLQGGLLAEVKAIVIGSFEITGVVGLKKNTPHVRVAVAFTANYTEVSQDGTEQSYWIAEAWEVTRKRDAISRPPQRIHAFGCPNCGAPLDGNHGSVCNYCKATVDTGEFDWMVVSIQETARQQRGPQLTGDTVEEGSDLETIIDPDAKSRLQALSAKDPTFAWNAFQSRVELIFGELQVAWSEREWKRARPFVSDGLFHTQLYWMTTYRKQKLRNVTEGARILGVQMAKITSDKHYDAVTVRIFASGLDYTLSDETGEIVSGSRTKERYYTEYWTLIRGANRTGAPRAEPTCPNCGAPLAVTMAGVCEHCQAKVASGEFDWVLSRIEQDEAYAG